MFYFSLEDLLQWLILCWISNSLRTSCITAGGCGAEIGFILSLRENRPSLESITSYTRGGRTAYISNLVVPRSWNSRNAIACCTTQRLTKIILLFFSQSLLEKNNFRFFKSKISEQIRRLNFLFEQKCLTKSNLYKK